MFRQIRGTGCCLEFGLLTRARGGISDDRETAATDHAVVEGHVSLVAPSLLHHKRARIHTMSVHAFGRLSLAGICTACLLGMCTCRVHTYLARHSEAIGCHKLGIEVLPGMM